MPSLPVRRHPGEAAVAAQEEALARAKRIYDLAATTVRLVAWEHDIVGNRTMLFTRAGPRQATREELLLRVHPDDAAQVAAATAAAFGGDGPLHCEYRVRRRDGGWAWERCAAAVVHADGDGRPTRLAGSFMDITAQKSYEQTLLEVNHQLGDSERRRARALAWSEARLRTVFDAAPMGLALLDARLCILDPNPGLCTLLGYTADALAGVALPQLAAPDCREAVTRWAARQAARLGPGMPLEAQFVGYTGQPLWVSLTLAAVDVQEAAGHLVLAVMPIDERKQAEQQLRAYASQVSALSGRLIHAQEEERRRIARELHDELGQMLTALQMAMSPARTLASGEEPCALPRTIIDAAIGQVRRMSATLRPPVLDDLGLLASLRELCRQHRELARMAVDVELVGDDRWLPPELSLTIYRVCQEALTNVARHAGATRVEVRFGAQPGHTVIVVRDNGRGFDPAAAPAGHLGLLGMRERVKANGGRLELASAPGQGTTVVAMFGDLPGSG
jgi:PAS domain S-box-containing protein